MCTMSITAAQDIAATVSPAPKAAGRATARPAPRRPHVPQLIGEKESASWNSTPDRRIRVRFGRIQIPVLDRLWRTRSIPAPLRKGPVT